MKTSTAIAAGILLGASIGTIFGMTLTVKLETVPHNSCTQFWGENCVPVYVPESISSTFSEQYYAQYRAQQAELVKQRNAEATKAQEDNVK